MVLTAGHCFQPGDTCDRYFYAPGFVYDEGSDAGANGPVRLNCSDLVTREVGTLADGSAIDYALIRLERPVEGVDSDPIVRERPVESGERLASMEFPEGLPLKIDPNGEALGADQRKRGLRLRAAQAFDDILAHLELLPHEPVAVVAPTAAQRPREHLATTYYWTSTRRRL
jgi:hypothetical protein